CLHAGEGGGERIDSALPPFVVVVGVLSVPLFFRSGRGGVPEVGNEGPELEGFRVISLYRYQFWAFEVEEGGVFLFLFFALGLLVWFLGVGSACRCLLGTFNIRAREWRGEIWKSWDMGRLRSWGGVGLSPQEVD
ncbi:unnamed protein product, partial [Ectocarpus sp. 8 AP-2014]